MEGEAIHVKEEGGRGMRRMKECARGGRRSEEEGDGCKVEEEGKSEEARRA